MRARRRRSVLNTVSAAVLEVAIMGLFVIIAQPQLRDALFEILHAGQPLPVAQASAENRPTSLTPAATLDRTVQAVMNNPVTQAVDKSLSNWTRTSASGGLRDQPVNSQPVNSQPTHGQPTQSQPIQAYVAGYSPFDQYESFRVNLPDTSRSGIQQMSVNSQTPVQPYAVPQYVPPQSYGVQNYAPTQLTTNQWNIASAAQSLQTTQTNNWIPSQVTETSFRQVYPPPYGTQNMWK